MTPPAIDHLVDRYLATGGYLHPDFTVHLTDGHYWVSCSATRSEHIMRIPQSWLIPMDGVRWAPREDLLEWADEPDLPPDTLAVLTQAVAALNEVDRVRRFGRAHARAVIGRDPDLAAALREVRPTWVARGAVSAAEAVAAARIHRLDMGAGMQAWWVPVSDLINQRPGGSRYHVEGTATVTLAGGAADDRTGECFVSAGGEDALGTALGHGYFEPRDRHVSPLYWQGIHPKLGRVTVPGAGRLRRSGASIPNVAQVPDEGLLITGLALDEGGEHRSVNLLALALLRPPTSLAPPTAQVVAQELTAAIWDTTIAHYQALTARISTPGPDPGASQLRTVLRQVCEHQLGLLGQWRPSRLRGVHSATNAGRSRYG